MYFTLTWLSTNTLPSFVFNNSVGMEDPFITASDFSSFLKLLEFVAQFFRDPRFGHPAFEASEHAKVMKMELAQQSGLDDDNWSSPPTNNTDFRLWLSHPHLSLPCEPSNKQGPGVRAEWQGVWYRYSSLQKFASHEIVSRELDLLFDTICLTVDEQREAFTRSPRHLVEGLSFGIRLDFSEWANHSDISIQVPFDGSDTCSLTASRIGTSPAELPPTTICLPVTQKERCLGPVVCEVTCIIDLLPLVTQTVLGLFRGTPDKTDDQESALTEMKQRESYSGPIGSDDSSVDVTDGTFSVAANLGDLRFFAFDPVLGPHLPVAFLSVASLQVTASQFAPSVPASSISTDTPPSDLQISVHGLLWADYFKLGRTRSWEPLLEPYELLALYEKSAARGSGLLLTSDTFLHLNVSGALLVIIHEVVDSFRQRIRETFGTNAIAAMVPNPQVSSQDKQVIEDCFGGLTITHEMPRAISSNERVAFAIRNMTGQKMRLCKRDAQARELSRMSAVVSYVDHHQSIQLSFLPSISMIKNLSVIEVDFPGLPNSNRICRDQVDLSGKWEFPDGTLKCFMLGQVISLI